MISHLVKWEHKDNWPVSYFKDEQKLGSGERDVKINMTNPIYDSLADYVVDGENILPVSSYLILVWETFGTMKGKSYTELPVVFEDVKFFDSVEVPKQGGIEITLMIQKGNNNIQVIL